MRAALSQALHYNDSRSAFGSRLSALPIRAPVLADLALEWAGAAHLAFRVAGPRTTRTTCRSEGTSNLMVTDVGRVLEREPTAIEPVLDELRPAAAEHPLLADAVADIEESIKDPAGRRAGWSPGSRSPWQAALLTEHAPPAVADAFVASRLGTGWGPGFGTLRGVDHAPIIDFARLG